MKTNVFYLMSIALTMLLSIGVMKTEAQVTIGKSEKPAEGALLDLKQQTASSDNITATKGLLYPRVALEELHELKPMFSSATTDKEKKAHVGMTVYNVSTTNGFVPGLHVWDGTSWVRPVTKLPEIGTTQLNVVDLVTETNQNRGTKLKVVSGGTNAAYGALGTELSFGHPSDYGNITIPEDGSYAFSFRFYGNISSDEFNSANLKTAIYYLSIWKDNTNNPSNLKDIAEIDINVTKRDGISVLDVYTYSITMGAFFNKDDKVIIKMSARLNTNDSNKVWTWDLVADPIRTGVTNAARTSMVWWKL